MRNAAAAAPPAPGTAGMAPGAAAFPGMPGFDGSSSPPIPGWNEALAWWTQVANGAGSHGGSGMPGAGFGGALDQFNSMARSWFTLMQQVASQMSPGANAGEIAQAWQRALGGMGDNPFADMFRAMRGPGQQGFDGWLEQAAPYLQSFTPWQGDGASMLGQPTFGFTREHQERWQKLIRANVDYQQHSQAYNALMSEAAQNAFKLFEKKLGERSEPGRQLETARALFDLWIEAAEESYAEIALSPRFREAYGSMVNSQMRLRAGLQREVEEVCELFGMPTRTEVDSAHRKLVKVERELRRIRDAIEAAGGLENLVARATSEGRQPNPARVRRHSGPSLQTAAAVDREAGVSSDRATAPAQARQRPVTRSEPVARTIVASDRPVMEQSVPVNAPAKRATARKAASKKAAAKNVATKKGARKSTASTSTSKTMAAKKATAKKSAAKKTSAAASRTAAKKVASRKSTDAGPGSPRPATNAIKARKRPAGKARVKKIPVEKAVARTAPPKTGNGNGSRSSSWAERARATTTAGDSPPAPVLKRPTRTASKRNSG
ncbi:MAG: class III poly(R)-hydroxyalkanoic acid synthase subunit PhaE [Pseudomonadota bacterium]|nr:class III poly(R)-hydroxyalkanoic acid synthase subunit PhaE [Pseudomonadota bacterium]